MHLSSSITGYKNPSSSSIIDIASFGQTAMHAEHPQHSLLSLNKTGISFKSANLKLPPEYNQIPLNNTLVIWIIFSLTFQDLCPRLKQSSILL